MRFGAVYDHEDEACRLARRPRGYVLVWPDGSVSWRRDAEPPVLHPEDRPVIIACGRSDAAMRRAYTDALRAHFRAVNAGA